MSEKKRDQMPENGQNREAERDSGLVDIFEEEETRRFRPADLEPEPRKADPEDEFQLEERDYRPIRFRRDSRTGCLGGLMYATFVICISIILACAGWMAACDLLALNKEPVTAAVTLPNDIFREKDADDMKLVLDIVRNPVEGFIEIVFLFIGARGAQHS